MNGLPTAGEGILRLLARRGVRHVFGIPGVHNAEIYRGFAVVPEVRHVTPRHEQGAGFMADGYARATGRPGVCFVISGPGLTNIATAMAQARGDSIPVLVISTCQPPGRLGTGNGYLHELLDQQALGSHLAIRSTTARSVAEIPALLDEAFALFASGRPGPVHIDIPTTFLAEPLALPAPSAFASTAPAPSPAVSAADLQRAVDLLDGARRPLVLAGGGARGAQAELVSLARRLGAPVCMTNNARGLLAPGDPLAVSHSVSLPAVRTLLAKADALLAVGTELGQTDYDMYDDGGFAIRAPLVRIDIDPQQAHRNAAPDVALVGDAAAVLDALGGACRRHEGNAMLSGLPALRAAATAELPARYRPLCALLEDIRDAVPGIVMVGDSTQISYAGSLAFAAAGPGDWFTASTGYGTLGYALPAAIGFQVGAPSRPVLAIVGDGGLQFTLAELGTARDAGAPVIVLLWNNRGFGEIKSFMRSKDIEPEGVDIFAPRFELLAQAYGWEWRRAGNAHGILDAILESARGRRATIIEVDEEGFFP